MASKTTSLAPAGPIARYATFKGWTWIGFSYVHTDGRIQTREALDALFAFGDNPSLNRKDFEAQAREKGWRTAHFVRKGTTTTTTWREVEKSWIALGKPPCIAKNSR